MEQKLNIENLIHIIRDKKVMLDFDLAMLYGVETKSLNQSVKRNIERFPEDFMFQLTRKEWNILRSQFVATETPDNQTTILLRSQFVTANKRGGTRYLRYLVTNLSSPDSNAELQNERPRWTKRNTIGFNPSKD